MDHQRSDDVRTELASVAARLQDLPEDAREERARLRERQQALRQQAGEDAVTDPAAATLEELRHREADLERRIERAVDQRVPAASIGGGDMGGAVHPYEAQELNRQIDDSSGLEQLRNELSRVRRAIEAREGDGR